MSVFPGLCGEIAAVPYRLFLGTQPVLAVEERLLRQLQAVFPWYASRKRVKEQANDFVELDLASCDAELMLRHSHVYYVRRQVHDELIDKQLTMIETGKSIKMADPALLGCLAECNTSITRRLNFELHTLQAAKRSCDAPYRRELNPAAVLEPYDYLCMMRVAEEDACGVPDAEMRARAFLPRDLIEAKAHELTAMLLGEADKKAAGTIDKRDARLLQRLVPGDYAKIGCIDKIRPADVTTLYRFVGERASKLPATPENCFRRSLYGHVCRKFASHPAYLKGISVYWARHCGMDACSDLTTMPTDLAEAVCAQQAMFPALKFRAQYLYTSPEVARQQWRTDSVIPLMRLFPTFGAQAAEDLAAAMVVEAEWARLQLEPEKSPLQESVVRAMRQFIDQMGGMYDSNCDAVLKRVEEGAKASCPPLSEAETRAMQPRTGQEPEGGTTPEAEAEAEAAQSAAVKAAA